MSMVEFLFIIVNTVCSTNHHNSIIIITPLGIASPGVKGGVIVAAVWALLPAVGLPAPGRETVLADAVRAEALAVLEDLVHVHGGAVPADAVSLALVGIGAPGHATSFAAHASQLLCLAISYTLALKQMPIL